MFSTEDDAFNYLKIKKSELREDALKMIINSPAYCYRFLLETSHTLDERMKAIQNLASSPEISYYFLLSNFTTTKEFIILLDSVLKNKLFSMLFIKEYQFSEQELTVCLDLVINSINTECAQNLIQNVDLSEEQMDKLYALLIINKITDN